MIIRKLKLFLLIKIRGCVLVWVFFIFLKASGESFINLTALEHRAAPGKLCVGTIAGTNSGGKELCIKSLIPVQSIKCVFFSLAGAFPPPEGQTKAISREMTLSNLWLVAIQSFAFLSGGMWYCLFQYLYHCLF